MKLEDLSVARRGKNVVVNHKKYEIEFNLSKGTWNYNDHTGKTIIKNGLTQISLTDGTTLKTTDAGFREFSTETVGSDAFGNYQSLRFSYVSSSTNELLQKIDSKSNLNQNTDKPDKKKRKETSSGSSDGQDDVSNGHAIRIHTYLTCYTDQPYILLKIGVENLSTSPVGLTDITLIDISTQQSLIQLGSPPSQYKLFLKMPPISPSVGAHRKIYDGFQVNRDNTLQPCQDGILYDSDIKKSLLFGFLSARKWWPRVEIGYQASKRKSQQGITTWALYHDCETKVCEPGKEITSETGYLDFSDDMSSSYNRYTERLAIESGAQTLQNLTENNFIDANVTIDSERKTSSGWSISAENKKGEISAKTIEEYSRSISESPIFKPTLLGGIEYIHLESGWQADPGELLLNKDCFPDGMSPVVEKIHADGFKASICIDPFAIHSKSKLTKKYPTVCLRTHKPVVTKTKKDRKQSGEVNDPVEVHLPGRKTALAILDVSHPEVQKYIKRKIKKIVDEWGYDLIKVDLSSYTSGMMSVAPNVTWYEDSLTSTELYQLALRLLTEAIDSIDNDVVLSGYNLIDSVGIGSVPINYPLLSHKYVHTTDSWHQQNGMKHKLSRYAAYLNEHNILWSNAYGDLAVDVPRPVNEAIVEMTAAALSGSAAYCINNPEVFSQQRAELVAKIFPISQYSATSIDRFEEPFPRIWHLPVNTPHESWHLIGIFNWKDQQDDIHLNLDGTGLSTEKDYLVHDFWMRQYLGIVSKNVTLLNIAPRSAKLLCLREQQDVPQLLSTDFHYTQGGIEILSAGWDNHSQSYLVVCRPPRQSEGTIYIHVPEDYIPINVSALGSEYQYNWDKPIYQLSFDATDTLIQASIQFTKTVGGL